MGKRSKQLTVMELCAGYNGLGMAVEKVFGARPLAFSEFATAPSKILAHRYPHVPNLGDMTKIDWAAVEPANIISGGTPCQDLSQAGRRAGMTEGTRSNLWANMREAIAIQRPTYVVWENVRGAFSAKATSDLEFCPRCMGETGATEKAVTLRALGRVLGDLSDLGYDAQWRGLRAADVGACHPRFRVFVLARSRHRGGRRAADAPADTDGTRGQEGIEPAGRSGQGGPSPLADQPGDRPAAHGDSPGRGQQRRTGAAPQEDPTAERQGPAAEDTDDATGGERRVTAPGETEGRGPRPDAGGRGGAPAPDAHGGRFEDGQERDGEPEAGIESPFGEDPNGRAAAITQGIGRGEGRTEPARVEGGPDAPLGGGAAVPDSQRAHIERWGIDGILAYQAGADEGEAGQRERDGDAPDGSLRALEGIEWGDYEPAIRRWETVIGRPAPDPTEPTGRNGAHRLSPAFTEWMMGLPEGWVTDPAIGLSRNEQLKACGDGVVPQQAQAALADMLLAFAR